MKPITLEMTAFGSYKQKTTVHFNEFTRGLFLISGETGSGKTMIFDAISFALYGKASGSLRDPSRMHSDLVPPGEDTVVKLVFQQNGREYAVRRTLHLSKKRGTENEYSDAKQDAELTEPDHVTVKGQEKVNARCTELLGMDVTQFHRIVMLAQGEFREFLGAPSEKKNEILGRLFDNSAFRRYQDLLSGAKNLLYEQRRESQEKLKSLIEEGFPEEDRLRYHPENPDFLDALSQLVSTDKERLNELDRKKTGLQEELQKLSIERGAADGVNQDLRELEEKKKHLEELLSREDEIQKLRNTTEVVGNVLHAVRPKIDARKRAVAAFETAKEEILKLGQELQKCEESLNEARKAVAGDAEAVDRVDTLNKEIHSHKKQLPGYKDLKNQTAEQTRAKAAEELARNNREAAEKHLRALNDEQKDIISRLEELKDIDHKVNELSKAYEETRKALELLSGKNGIKETVQSIKAAGSELAADEKKLVRLTEKAGEAAGAHHDLYQRFIAGQAGVLADKLRSEIESAGAAACPVCGAVHTKAAGHELFAVKSEDTPRESDVKDAEDALEKAEKSRRQQDILVQDKKKALEERKNDLLRKADSVFPECTWEQLSDADFIKKAEQDISQKSKTANSDLKEAENLQEERSNLVIKQDENKKSLEEAASRIDALKQEESRQHAAFAAAESAVAALKNLLKLESAEAAQKEIKKLTDELVSLKNRIQEHTDAESKAQNDVSRTKGSLDGKRKELPGLKAALEEAEQKTADTLAENGFSDEAAAEAVLAPIGNADEESWLQEQMKALHDFDGDCRNTQSRITELKNKTEGKIFTDLDDLDARIGEKLDEQKAAEDEYSSENSRLTSHEKILSKAKEYKSSLASTDQAWKRLDALGTLAVGSSGDGGKLSFDRYVMGAVFREILEMANHRIDIMSGGQYELVHQTENDRKNAKAGLDIEVLVTGTGKRRPSNNLSGGEGFYASLALALGLSDVVQMHSGEKKLDALFIDEGFGTLSPDVLDKALNVLDQLSAGDRLVGIISHVDKLDESIPQKIRVSHDENGSHIRQELS